MSERPNILVVDDEPAVLQALTRASALERYDVDVARDGDEALEGARSTPLRHGRARRHDAGHLGTGRLPAPARERRPQPGADADCP